MVQLTNCPSVIYWIIFTSKTPSVYIKFLCKLEVVSGLFCSCNRSILSQFYTALLTVALYILVTSRLRTLITVIFIIFLVILTFFFLFFFIFLSLLFILPNNFRIILSNIPFYLKKKIPRFYCNCMISIN